MKCYICDAEINDKEIQYNADMKAFEPCPSCLEIAMEAAYSDGFLIDDDEILLIDDLGDSSDIVPRVLEINDE